MERYTLKELYNNKTALELMISTNITSSEVMGLTATQYSSCLSFIVSIIYGYFYDDLVAYQGETTTDVKDIFIKRLSYDIELSLPYWYKKYNYVKKLLTTEDFSLLQTSNMTSSSSEKSNSASGTLQKTATTPTGVSAGSSSDSFDISIDFEGTDSVETTGFADKYTNAQQKFANATKVEGDRSGNILREGSIDELLDVLEKLPSTFGDEINRKLQKHFIFDYDGEMKGIYEGA